MSLINKVLRELDERQALAGEPGAQPPKEVRVVARAHAGGREWFWRTLAVLMLACVGWVGWVAWEISPRPVVTEEGLRAGAMARRSATRPQPAPLAAASPDPASAAPPPAVSAEAQTASPQTHAAAGPPASQSLRLAVAIETPVGEPAAAPSESRSQESAGGQQVGAPQAAARPRPAGPSAQEAAALKLDVPQARILAPPVRGPVRVERREREPSAGERAEREFRRAVALLRDGRPTEAEQVLAAAIGTDPSHAAARQALVALLLERGRLEESAKLLEDGLAIHPGNVAFAVALARIHIERRNAAAALAVLEPLRRELLANARHAQLLAAVEQRLERHAEAAEALRAALAAEPGNGAAWAALGVSLEALGHKPEAAEAYRRALAAGGLSAQAEEHAERRLRALR